MVAAIAIRNVIGSAPMLPRGQTKPTHDALAHFYPKESSPWVTILIFPAGPTDDGPIALMIRLGLRRGRPRSALSGRGGEPRRPHRTKPMSVARGGKFSSRRASPGWPNSSFPMIGRPIEVSKSALRRPLKVP